jgi:hypothetical protein
MKAFIPAWLDELQLTAQQFRVYCHLCRRADASGECYPALASISKKCKISVNTVKNSIKELATVNLISIKHGGNNVSNRYTIQPEANVSNGMRNGSNGTSNVSNGTGNVSNETTLAPNGSNEIGKRVNPVIETGQMGPTKVIQEGNPLEGSKDVSQPASVSLLENQLPAQQLDMQKMMAQINNLKPAWGKPSMWNHSEMRLLADGVAQQLAELDAHDWKTLKNYLNANHAGAKGFWNPHNRSKFVETFPDVFASCQRWAEKANIKPPRKTSASVSGEINYH